ncbi:Uncharacterised protein [Bordetella pertussis]|nr:Uncharacterised protein [Bordetella pertussis]CFM95709.1 Uncharacterised protein [Bordetella pertussis]CFN98928.1 Uncharacterised protein [Bordetella pertussis]CPI42574.1 Uncharacterised protein [Bordetella pertussis]CPK29262.1 Uncharacterised protein [Bordetella pertussis]
MTSGLKVSIDNGTPQSRSPSISGRMRASSSAALTGCAPGRVDSPPRSRIWAPSSINWRAWAIALSVSACSPPSENESGVTLTMPMTSGRSRSNSKRPHWKLFAMKP